MGLVAEAGLGLRPGMLENGPHPNLAARERGSAGAIETTDEGERTVAKRSGVPPRAFVDRMCEVDGEARLDDLADVVDGVLEVRDDPEPNEVCDVPESFVAAIGPSELLREARARLESHGNGM